MARLNDEIFLLINCVVHVLIVLFFCLLLLFNFVVWYFSVLGWKSRSSDNSSTLIESLEYLDTNSLVNENFKNESFQYTNEILQFVRSNVVEGKLYKLVREPIIQQHEVSHSNSSSSNSHSKSHHNTSHISSTSNNKIQWCVRLYEIIGGIESQPIITAEQVKRIKKWAKKRNKKQEENTGEKDEQNGNER